ncbi:MAG: transcriptional regulator [Phycisphaerales bacterium]|nr:transcriptional regulator [Phycisphaerae bacterium]NNF42858.1 transcriptional regulator [Phycisphaerales bacterium]NNM27087.1 transcriptional regulator [Phycisphaerales bacterium]
MTGTLPPQDDSLRAARERFVALWGQMGSTWGIPRTMAQVHALLFVRGEAMNTDEVMEGLGISRGNASMTLRRLVDWGIVSRVHRRGDRKEYFLAEQDVWKMFRTILAQRKKREIEPLLDALADCRLDRTTGRKRKVDQASAAIESHNDRLQDLLVAMRAIDSICDRFSGPGGKGLEIAVKLLDRAS